MTMPLWRVFGGSLSRNLYITENIEAKKEAMEDIREYIEIFYNRQRKRAKLDYLSPVAYEKKYYEKKMVA